MAEHENIVLYDGECPFCTSYVHFYRIKNAAGSLSLIDARQPSPLRDKVTAMGIDLDKGMVLSIDGNIFHGDQAMHMMALLSTRSGIFNSINYWIFRSPRISKILYPYLRACRGLTLKIRRVSTISNLDR